MRIKKTILMGLIFALLVSLLPMHGAMSSVSSHPSDMSLQSMDISDTGLMMNHSSAHKDQDGHSAINSDCSDDGRCCLAVPSTSNELRAVHIYSSYLPPVVSSGIISSLTLKPPQA